jgi:DNA-binding HxlR family transcriptional regulator
MGMCQDLISPPKRQSANLTCKSAGAGKWASVAQKVVSYNDHLKQGFYNQHDQRLTTIALFSRLIRYGATGAGATDNCYAKFMQKKKAAPKRRSGCPLNASVEMLGDRWSLLILRDMMLRGYQTFNEFLHSDEKIATNILADRLRRLESYEIIEMERDPAGGRKMIYVSTPKGIDLALVLAEMVLWAARHEKTGNQPLVRQMRTAKEQLLAGVRQRWEEKRGPK